MSKIIIAITKEIAIINIASISPPIAKIKLYNMATTPSPASNPIVGVNISIMIK